MRLGRWICMAAAVCALVGCNKYEQPIIFGVPYDIWHQMSYRQQEIVAENATGPRTYSLNWQCFNHCRDISKVPGTGQLGYAEPQFGECLRKCMPVGSDNPLVPENAANVNAGE